MLVLYMRKLNLTILILLLAASGSVSLAQQNVVKLNLTGLAFVRASIGYERAFAENHSGVLWVDFGSYSVSSSGGDFSSTGDQKFTYGQYGVNLEYRYYPQGVAPRKFYVGPYLVVRNIGFKVKEEGEAYSPNDVFTTYKAEGKVNSLNVGGGVQLGYQWLIGDVFAIDLFGGVGYYSFNLGDYDVKAEYDDGTSETASSDNNGSFNISGVLPRLGICVGIGF